MADRRQIGDAEYLGLRVAGTTALKFQTNEHCNIAKKRTISWSYDGTVREFD